MNPLLKMAAGVLKVRTLCSKWQLGQPKYEHFAENGFFETQAGPKSEPFVQNGSQSAQSTNPLLKMAAGASKVRTFCSKWQLECPEYELLKMAVQALEHRPAWGPGSETWDPA